MRRTRHPNTPAFLVLLMSSALAAGPAPAQAQQPGDERVAFRATVGGPVAPFFMLPFDPPIAVASNTATGESDLLGAVSFAVYGCVHFGADGLPKRETDGLGVFSAEGGDAIFLNFSGLIRATETGFLGEQFFTITGGKGRFLGATGSGPWIGRLDAKTNEVILQIERTVSRPKP
jgi:hypothetical protein